MSIKMIIFLVKGFSKFEESVLVRKNINFRTLLKRKITSWGDTFCRPNLLD